MPWVTSIAFPTGSEFNHVYLRLRVQIKPQVPPVHVYPLGNSRYQCCVHQGPVQSRVTTPQSEQSRCDVKNIDYFRGSNYYVETPGDSKEYPEGE